MSDVLRNEYEIIVKFNVPVNFELDFLSKSFPLKIKNFTGVIEFPEIDLDSQSKKDLKINSINVHENWTWGKKNDNHINIEALLIRLDLDEDSFTKFPNGDGNKIVNNWINLFKTHLEISSSQTLKSFPKPQHTLFFNGESAGVLRIITFSLFKLKHFEYLLNLCENLKNIPIELDLINEARIELDFQNYRKVIIESATAAEISLTKICRKRLLEIHSESFTKDLLNNKYKTLGNRFKLADSLDILLDDNFNADITSLRNKVIHDGYSPTQQEASISYKKCEKIIKRFSDLEYFN